MTKIVPLLVVLGVWVLSLHAAESVRPGESRGPVTKLLDIELSEISEMSGLAKSHRFDDVYWMHNDSGDSARLFAVNGKGETIFPGYLSASVHGGKIQSGKQPWQGIGIEGAANIDWEDIAVDDEHIYIAEMGNNMNTRRDLGVYVIAEPNPWETERLRALKFIPVRYPDQKAFPAREWHFDSEGMFVDDGTLYFFTKHRQPGKQDSWERGTVLYRLDSDDIDRTNVLTRIGQHPVVTLVTAADLSPNGEWLAVLCYTQLWLFPRPPAGDDWLAGKPRYIELSLEFTGQAEAITWMDDETLLIGNEQSEWFKVYAGDIPFGGPEPGTADQSVR